MNMQICSTNNGNGGCSGADGGCSCGGDDEFGEPPNIEGRAVGDGLLVPATMAPAVPALVEKLDFNSNLNKNHYTNDEGLFDFDYFLQTTLGEFGRYQQFIVWLLCVPACFLSAYGTMDMVFLSYTPDFTCNTRASFDNLMRKASSSPDSTLERWVGDNSSKSHLVSFQIDPKDACHFRAADGGDGAGFAVPNDSMVITDRGNGTTSYSSSSLSEQLACSSWNYDKTYFRRTIVTDWNLVCDKAIAARSIVSLLNLAILFAAIYTLIEDKWGRKRAFLLNLCFFLTGSCGSLMAPTPIIFALLKFVGSITCMWEICYTWALEFVGPSQRTCLTTLLSVIYCVATISLALLAYLCNTWVELGLCTSAPFIVLFSFAFIVPESPRWLITQGRVDDAVRVIETMARWHKVKIDLVALRDAITGRKSVFVTAFSKAADGDISSGSSSALLINKDEVKGLIEDKPTGDCQDVHIAVIATSDEVSSASSDETGSTKSVGIGEFFASTNLRWKSLFMTVIEVVANQLYYAIPFSLETLSANFYISYVLQAAVEAPATLINLLLLNRFGRVVPLSVSLFLSGFCCLLTLAGSSLFGGWVWGPVMLVVASRFFVCTAVAIVEQLGGELFPTVARGTGQGVSYFVSSLASISTQYILYARHVWSGLPMLIFGNVILVASLMALFLPETMGKSLPDTVRQAEAQGSVGWESFKRNVPKILACVFKGRRKQKNKQNMYKLQPSSDLIATRLYPDFKA